MTNEEIEIAKRELTELSIAQFGALQSFYATAVQSLNAFQESRNESVYDELLDLVGEVANVELPDEKVMQCLDLSNSFVELNVSLELIVKLKQAVKKANGAQ